MNVTAAYTRRNPEPKKRRGTGITVPKHVGPHVKLLFEAMKEQNITYDEVENRSGVKRVCMKAWRHKNRPNLDTIEAALSVVGYEFVALPTARALPPTVIEALRPTADALGLAMPEAVRLAAEMAYRDHHLSAIRETA